jgi:hypothetical protein
VIVLAAAGVLHDEVKEYLASTPSIRVLLPHLCMDLSKMPHLQSVSDVDPAVPVDGETVSTLSFTSGSTGIPKGCRGRAISLTHFYPWMSSEFGLSETDRFSFASGIAHDPVQRVHVMNFLVRMFEKVRRTFSRQYSWAHLFTFRVRLTFWSLVSLLFGITEAAFLSLFW